MEAGGPSSLSSEGRNGNKKGLARKLTCSVLCVVSAGVILILLMQVFLTRKAVPEWGAETEDAMTKLEEENILRLASAKADFITEIFGRVGESVLQLQAFAAQALLEVPVTMVVDNYVMSYPGLEQDGSTWEHSVWWVRRRRFSERS